MMSTVADSYLGYWYTYVTMDLYKVRGYAYTDMYQIHTYTSRDLCLWHTCDATWLCLWHTYASVTNADTYLYYANVTTR